MIILDLCSSCIHERELTNGQIKCDAFPNGKPKDFLGSSFTDCNNGLHFEPKEGKEHPMFENNGNLS